MTDRRSSETPAAGAYEFDLSGGALCLDFVNTLGDRPLCRSEHLHEPRDLLAWACQAGVLTPAEARAGGRWISEHMRLAGAGLDRAIELREALFRIFAGWAAERRPVAGDLTVVDRRLTAGLERRVLELRGDRFVWGWRDAPDPIGRVLGVVALSAADLLTSDELQWVRQCDSETCSWLFVDRSRTRRRRWCDMKTCGNRAKARRFQARQRAVARR